MREQAILNTHSNVLSIDNGKPLDKNGKEVILDEALIEAEISKLNSLPPPKEEQLSNLIVTISTGKRFYADAESRTDLLGAIIEAQSQNATDVDVINWKTADGWKEVTLAELKEASKVALEAKAQIIGAS